MEALNIIARELGFFICKDESSCPDYRGYMIMRLEDEHDYHAMPIEGFDTLKECAKFLRGRISQ